MTNNTSNDKQSIFENKIKPVLLYVGTIGAVLTVIAYIAIIFILIFGFKLTSFSQTLIFSIVNGVIGFVVMQLLKIQGIDFAKSLDKNKEILDKYIIKQPKKQKTHSMKYFWITSTIQDIISKVLIIVLSTAGLIYIVVVGSNDYNMLILAFANIMMFTSFGLLALVNSYNFFNEKYIPFIVEQMEDNDNSNNSDDKEITDIGEEQQSCT